MDFVTRTIIDDPIDMGSSLCSKSFRLHSSQLIYVLIKCNNHFSNFSQIIITMHCTVTQQTMKLHIQFFDSTRINLNRSEHCTLAYYAVKYRIEYRISLVVRKTVNDASACRILIENASVKISAPIRSCRGKALGGQNLSSFFHFVVGCSRGYIRAIYPDVGARRGVNYNKAARQITRFSRASPSYTSRYLARSCASTFNDLLAC